MKNALARTLLLAGSALFPAIAGNQILLRNLNSADGSPKVLSAGSTGLLFVVSELSLTTTQQVSRVVKLDLTGARLASIDLAQLEIPMAAATDPLGDLVVVGSGPTFQGVVVKVDPQFQSATTLASLPAVINAVTTDPAGNIYLTGSTSSGSFPVTPGAYQAKPPTAGFQGSPAYSFLTKLSPAGQVLYSTYFGSDATSCNGGSFCIGKYAITTGTAIALDASGAAIIAGTTIATGLPTTPGALAQNCVCGYDFGLGVGVYSGFVAKFQPGSAQQLVWATYLNAGFSPVSFALDGLALDSAGDVIVGGGASPGLPTTSGVFQVPGAAPDPNGGAFLVKLNSSGTAALWGTYFGAQGSAVQALSVDAQGRVTFSGYLGSSTQAELQYKPTFVGRATSDGKTLTDFYEGPETYYLVGPAVANISTGGFASLFPAGALWIESAAPGPSLLNVANSASGIYSSTVSGVELISLYGVGIGPQTPVNGQVQSGAFTSALGGCQVLFDSVPAPLLYAGSGQINAVAPRTMSVSPHIQVITPSGTIDGPTLSLSWIPTVGIFPNGQSGLAAALNQDGSTNSSSNPARSGSIVSVFATADAGSYFPDGAVVPMAIYDAAMSVWVVDSYRSLEVVFAGDAPGLVAGVMQINFRLPDPLPPGNTFTFSVIIGGSTPFQSQIAVAQE